MRHCARIVGVIMLLAWAPAVLAQTAHETALREAITRQLEAMNRGDAAAAFAIASPAIQKHFGDAPTFMGVVERSYPQVYRSRSHRFLKLDIVDDKLIQRVLIESDSGTVVALYEMIQIDGAWRINSCTIEKRDGA
jgi:hypothetical protein